MKNLCIAVVIAASSVLTVSAQNTNPTNGALLLYN